MSRTAPKVASIVLASGLLLTAGCSSSGGSGGTSASPTTSEPVTQVSATPNGIENLPAPEILAKAKASAEGATSVKVDATIPTGTDEITVDVEMTPTGAQGTIAQKVGSFQMITTQDMIFIKGDSNFNAQYGGGEAAAKLLEGKWLAVPTSNPSAANYKGFSSSKEFFGGVLAGETTFTKGQTKDVNGVPSLALDSGDGALYVATVGEPFPMSVEPKAGEQGSMQFSNWNAPVTITPPPENEVVDLSQLRSGPSASSS